MMGTLFRLLTRLNDRLRRHRLFTTPFMQGLRRQAKVRLARLSRYGGHLSVSVAGYHMTVPDERYVWLYSAYEPFSSEILCRILRPGDVVVDVGACFGYFSLLSARAVGPTGCVHAFEPLPGNFEVLARNVSANGLNETIEPVPRAVSNRGGHMQLHLSAFRENTTLAREPLFGVGGTVPVEAVTLDDYLGIRRVDFVKLDVEGYEPRALDGMRRVLGANPGLSLLVELNAECLQRAGSSAEALCQALRDHGRRVDVIDEDGQVLVPASAETFALATREPGRLTNLLCTPETGHAADVRNRLPRSA